MRTLLKFADGSEEYVVLPSGPTVVGIAILRRGSKYFVFDGYLGGYAHTALFTECNEPFTLDEPDPKPKPRRFMGQKPKEQDNG